MPAAESALETRVFRKLLLFIMPAVLIAFIDHINISFAAPTMNKAIGIDPKTFGLGAGIFFVGYLLFEIPSNVVLARIGARFWISRIMIVWGLVAALVVFWTLPASTLRVDERPVGIALVTCVGLVGSFLAPTITGWLKEATGNYQGGMFLAAAGMVIAALATRAGAKAIPAPLALPQRAARI